MILYNREARVCGSHSLRLTFIDGATRHNACSAVVGRLGGSGRRSFLGPPPYRGDELERLKMQQVPRSTPLTPAGVPKPVIFFDDVCVMCNGFVNLL